MAPTKLQEAMDAHQLAKHKAWQMWNVQVPTSTEERTAAQEEVEKTRAEVERLLSAQGI